MMKQVIVMGAGVVGVTTAWYLRQAGFSVTVIEQEPAPALQTSFANGGQISVCHTTPWANPSTPMKAFKWLFHEDAPLLYRFNLDWYQWRWGWQFLQQCRARLADENLVQMVNLGLYSRQALQDLRAKTGIEYQAITRGIMHFYTDQVEFEQVDLPTRRMQALGCDRQRISVDRALDLEPALMPIAQKLVGATYTPEDESGNARLFTQNLAKLCVDQGVEFVYDTQIVAINLQKYTHHQPMVVESLTLKTKTQAGDRLWQLQAEAYVMALGSYGVFLSRPLGVDLPIFPAKGYSATYPINPKLADRVPFVSLIDDEYKLVTSRLGDTLRVAGTAEFNGYNTALNSVRCHAITRRVKQLFDNEAILFDQVEYWTGLRPMTPSNVPLIGKAHLGKVWHGSTRSDLAQNFANLWLNMGHGTLGWTHACGSAKALTALILGDRPDLDFQFVGMDWGEAK